MTWPDSGLIWRMKSVYQTFAHTAPSMNSSSFRCWSGCPFQVTASLRRGAKVSASRYVRTFVPSLWTTLPPPEGTPLADPRSRGTPAGAPPAGGPPPGGGRGPAEEARALEEPAVVPDQPLDE